MWHFQSLTSHLCKKVVLAAKEMITWKEEVSAAVRARTEKKGSPSLTQKSTLMLSPLLCIKNQPLSKQLFLYIWKKMDLGVLMFNFYVTIVDLIQFYTFWAFFLPVIPDITHPILSVILKRWVTVEASRSLSCTGGKHEHVKEQNCETDKLLSVLHNLSNI